ncbi:MAG: hypothetical protein J6Y19_02105 [Kiritimatiellae bacterium]|nr:hypothetical protein [Kiritimatiellia bacterium]
MEIGSNWDKWGPDFWKKRWRQILDIFFALFFIAVIFNKLLVIYHKHATRTEDAGLASWLVGYTPGGGYVRRGLSGELLWWLNQCGISPEYIIFPLCLAAFVAVWAWFVTTVVKRGLNWWILPTSFCLGGLFPTTRDYCVLLLVMSMIRVHARIRSFYLRFVFVNLIGIAAIHLHEISFFVAVPFLFLLLWSESRSWRGKLIRAVSLTPMLLSFCLIAVFRGNIEVCSKMATAWDGALQSGYWDNVHIIDGLKVSIESKAAFYAHLTMNNLFIQRTAGLPNALWLAIFGMCIFLVASRGLFLYRKGVKAESLPTLVLFQALCLIPVFPFFIDYSRLFAYAILSSYWFWLEMGDERIGRAFPFRFCFATWDTGPRCLLLVCLLLFIGMSTINLVVGECFARSAVGHLGRSAQFAFRKSKHLFPVIQEMFSEHGAAPNMRTLRSTQTNLAP